MNLDGTVDFNDIVQLLGAGKYNTGQPANWSDGDINYDGSADFNDIVTLLGSGNYNNGQTFSPSAARDLAPPSRTDRPVSARHRHRRLLGAGPARNCAETQRHKERKERKRMNCFSLSLCAFASLRNVSRPKHEPSLRLRSGTRGSPRLGEELPHLQRKVGMAASR